MSPASRLFGLALGVLALVILPRLLKIGMFFDGVMIASITRNLAEGQGTFWAPHYTGFVHVEFFEFLPLGLWLQSLVYRLFGDHVALDGVWGAVMGLVIMLLLVPVWRLSRPQSRSAGTWWPALLFLSFPLTGKILSHNQMESTVATFVLAASALALIGLRRVTLAGQVTWSAAAGVLLLGAVLAKGPQALFVLALPPCAALVGAGGVRWRQALLSTLVMSVLVTGGLAVLYLASPGAREHFQHFAHQRLLKSFLGERRELVASRWAVLSKLAFQLSVPAGLGALAALLGRSPPRVLDNRQAAFFLAVGCCGSLPLVLSPVQYGRYLFPSLPFFAFAVAALFEPVALRVEALVARSRAYARGIGWGAVGCGALAVVLMLVNAGTVRRAQAFHADFTLQDVRVEPRRDVSVCPSRLAYDWNVVANMQRVYRATLVPAGDGRLLLVEKGHECVVPPRCQRLQPARPERYELYRCEGGAEHNVAKGSQDQRSSAFRVETSFLRNGRLKNGRLRHL